MADQALNMLNVDQCGFDNMDRLLLTTVIDKFDGGPVGVENLAAAIGEEKSTIEDVLEEIVGREIIDESDKAKDMRELARSRNIASRKKLIRKQNSKRSH